MARFEFMVGGVNPSCDRYKLIERLHSRLLREYVKRHVEMLNAQSYNVRTVYGHVKILSLFDQWLAGRNGSLRRLNSTIVRNFVSEVSKLGYVANGAMRPMRCLLNMLRSDGVAATEKTPRPTPAQRLADSFGRHLAKEQGLAESTRCCYQTIANEFLKECFGTGEIVSKKIGRDQIVGFIRGNVERERPRHTYQVVCVLRSFFRFLQYRGEITSDLAMVVPTVARWPVSSLPKHLPAGAIQKILDSCNRRTVSGQRDYAILLLIARLGLRAGEVVTLRFEDIDWANARITVRSRKGAGWARMPLPEDVGAALAEYLQHGRKRNSCRQIFVSAVAPHRAFAHSARISSIARRAIVRAGVESGRKGAHLFRHSLATEMLRRGASLDEIGQVLRHRSPVTTTIYAKVDFAALRPLAMAWPGGVL